MLLLCKHQRCSTIGGGRLCQVQQCGMYAVTLQASAVLYLLDLQGKGSILQ
jgi:hypothetical protein